MLPPVGENAMRRLSTVALAGIGLLSAATAPAAPTPDVHGETLEQTAARTGYTADEIRASFPPIAAWPLEPRPDTTAPTFARDRFKPPPAPGVHPRIYFNPEDLPDIRRRLKETHVGRVLMESIRGRLLQVSPKQSDWEGVPYKPKAEDYARYRQRGLRIEPRMGYRGPWIGGWINDLAAGKVPAELDGTWTKPTPASKRQYLMHLLPFEAFRCLIDEDAAGGRRVGAALATIARCLRHTMSTWTVTTNWQAVYQPLGSDSVGLTYDWAHGWMTEDQRAVVRRAIADITRGKQYIGLDHVPGFPGNTSNWNIIHANLLPMVLAIEGEEGYDEAVYRRIVEGLKKWVYVASGPDGAPFEGLTKSNYAPHWLLPLARRGHPFLGSQWSVNHIRRFHLHVMLPWGDDYVFETGIGPARRMEAFKFAHPADPVVDLVYAETVRDLFDAGEPDRARWPNCRTTYAPWWPYLFLAEDPIGAQDGTYDHAKAFDGVMASLAKSEPLTYLSDYRGLMTARTGWNRDAAFLYFEPRHVPGGHTRASRNEFVFASHGRVWAQRTVAVEDTSEMHSVVLVDGKGQGKQGGRCPAGRTVGFVDAPQATFAAADAAWAYGHLLVSADKKEAVPVTVTPNDSRLRRSPLPWMDRPWSFLPNWASGCKPAPKQDPGGHGYWVPYNPLKYAYRTCGLVRGKRPYVLIVDDIRKDDAEHDYAWLMQVQNDIKVAESTKGTIGRDGVVDLVLADETGRRLLLRVLAAGDAGQARATQAGAKLETYENKTKRGVSKHKRVILPLRAVTGQFTVLLFPHREGDPLPKTAWDEAGRTLAVEWPDQRDALALAPGDDGRTRLVLTRDGKKLAKLD
jgi:hypothetical protein